MGDIKFINMEDIKFACTCNKHEYKIEMEMKLSRGGDSNNPISLCVYPKPTLGLPSAYVSWSFLSLMI
jgi:hypothetical protein